MFKIWQTPNKESWRWRCKLLNKLNLQMFQVWHELKDFLADEMDFIFVKISKTQKLRRMWRSLSCGDKSEDKVSQIFWFLHMGAEDDLKYQLRIQLLKFFSLNT